MSLRPEHGPFANAVRALPLYKSEFLQKLIADTMRIHGWLCNYQIPILWHMAGGMRGNFVEVGVWKGRTSLVLLSAADPKQFRLHCVDTFLGSEEHQGVELQKGESTREEFEFNININGYHDNVTVVQKPSVEAAKDYPDEYFDGAFIDAAHDYDNLTADIHAWYPKLKRGAPMLFHDYPQPNPDGSHNPETGFADLFRALNEHVRDAKDKFEGWGYAAGLAGAYKK